jgi:hypothetical protein
MPRTWPSTTSGSTTAPCTTSTSALDHWFRRRGRAYAQDVPDLHYLAHGLCFGNRVEQAAPVFDLIGDLAASTPWSLAGDPASTFVYWRSRALSGRR